MSNELCQLASIYKTLSFVNTMILFSFIYIYINA